MLAPFLIMLREGLEAALIVGVIASYLRQTGRDGWLPAIWIGVFLAVAASFAVGAALQFASAEFPQKTQELFEALVGLVAAALLTGMVFWMRKAARTIASDLRHSVDEAFASGSGAWGLVAMAFFAVAREGLESIFFLLAVVQQSPGPGAALGALAGVVRQLHEAGLWNHLQTLAYDLTGVLPVSSPVGAVLAGLFNYHDAPTIGEVAVYVTFLAVTLYLLLRPHAPFPQAERAAAPLKVRS